MLGLAMQLQRIQNKYKSSFLFRHLTWVLVIKVILLIGIWLAFVKNNTVKLNIVDVAQHLTSSSAENTDTPSSNGAKQ
jgi:cytoskeletal protein RodZ